MSTAYFARDTFAKRRQHVTIDFYRTKTYLDLDSALEPIVEIPDLPSSIAAVHAQELDQLYWDLMVLLGEYVDE